MTPAFPKPVRAPKKPRKPLRRGKPMARATLARGEPLGRSRMRRQPTKPRQGAAPGYVAWLHAQECVGELCWPGEHTCAATRDYNPIEQSHERDMTGVGRKEPDIRSVPKCRVLHSQWELRIGRFDGWTKPERRDWMRARIEETNARWFALTPEARAEWDRRAAAQRKGTE